MDLGVSIKELKEICITYLERFNNKRKFLSQISNAIDKVNSNTKKLCFSIIKEIFENENNPYYLFLDDKEVSNKIIKLLKKGIEEEIAFNNFKTELFDLSIDIEFIYKLSELYSNCFSKNADDYWGEYLNFFIFEKKFKIEYINKVLYHIGIEDNEKDYKNFLMKIKNKYDNKKQFNDELKKIFIISENKKETTSLDEQNNKKEYSETNNNNDATSQQTNQEFNTEKNIESNPKNENENDLNINIESNKVSESSLGENQNSSENKFNINKYKDIEIIESKYTVSNYLHNQYNKYNKNNNKYKNESFTPVLKDILYNKKIKFTDIGYYKSNYFDSLNKINDKTLSVLIKEKLDFKNNMGDNKEFGYFKYKY